MSLGSMSLVYHSIRKKAAWQVHSRGEWDELRKKEAGPDYVGLSRSWQILSANWPHWKNLAKDKIWWTYSILLTCVVHLPTKSQNSTKNIWSSQKSNRHFFVPFSTHETVNDLTKVLPTPPCVSCWRDNDDHSRSHLALRELLINQFLKLLIH